MTGEEYSRKKAILRSYEALTRNDAWRDELLPLFARHLQDALAGLRNRTSREKRDEYLQAADNAEALLRHVPERIETLTSELGEAAETLSGLDQDE